MIAGGIFVGLGKRQKAFPISRKALPRYRAGSDHGDGFGSGEKIYFSRMV